jgi:hypothetical protein
VYATGLGQMSPAGQDGLFMAGDGSNSRRGGGRHLRQPRARPPGGSGAIVHRDTATAPTLRRGPAGGGGRRPEFTAWNYGRGSSVAPQPVRAFSKAYETCEKNAPASGRRQAKACPTGRWQAEACTSKRCGIIG